jgi:hypothetical protein
MLEGMLPDEKVFRSHVRSGTFQSGVDHGWWRLVSISWPIALIGVAAAPRPNVPSAPAEYIFRFDCANYPQSAPTAQPWDADRNAPLEPAKWPGGRIRMTEVFRPDWAPGQVHCLYAPCDRLSIVGHDGWQSQHPHLIWKSTSNITLYLGFIHDLLNSLDYTGSRGA